jgi:hypothetical protein
LNIVTRQLLRAISDAELIAFVEDWDLVESIIIDIYKRGAATRPEAETYAGLRPKLAKAYAAWMAPLRRYWQGLDAGGRPIEQDPFELVLSRRRADAFIGDWGAMQTLPVARQAINHFLLDLGGSQPARRR